MRVPKKINPDRIRDAIVQVFFSTEIPFEPLVGFVYQALVAENFLYLNSPPQKQRPQIFSASTAIEFQLGPQHFFYNEDISVRLDEPAALTFKCLGSYIGWTSYFKLIEKVLGKLFTAGVINTFLRVGIRYVNEFEDMDIQDALTLSFEMGALQQSSYRVAQLRTVWDDEQGYQVAATLSTERISESEKKSVIDIDVILQGFEISDLQEMIGVINAAHTREKEIFFGLMKPEFLANLNPDYE